MHHVNRMHTHQPLFWFCRLHLEANAALRLGEGALDSREVGDNFDPGQGQDEEANDESGGID